MKSFLAELNDGTLALLSHEELRQECVRKNVSYLWWFMRSGMDPIRLKYDICPSGNVMLFNRFDCLEEVLENPNLKEED